MEDFLMELTPEEWEQFLAFVFGRITETLTLEQRIEIAVTLLEQREKLSHNLFLHAFDLLTASLREWYGKRPVRSVKDAEFALEMEAIKPLPEKLRTRLDALLAKDFLIMGLVGRDPLLVQKGVELLAGEPVTVREAYHAVAPDVKKELHRQHRIDRNPGGTGRHPKREHEKADTSYMRSEEDRSPLEREPDQQRPELEWLTRGRRDVAEMVAEADFIRRAFAQLKEEEQTLLRLDAEGYTDAEIAQMLNLPRETIKKRRQRAKERLRRALAE